MTERHIRELFRRFEPILKFNGRENYLPMRVDPYLARATCYQNGFLGRAVLVQDAPLSLDGLGHFPAADRNLYFLRFVPDEALKLAPSRRGDYSDDPRYPPSFDRVLDQFPGAVILGRAAHGFFVWLWNLLGSLPRNTVAAAYRRVQAIPSAERVPTYYGRALAGRDCLILQYWFFYAVNDWRSNSLGLGVNDHEGDWEHVDVVLESHDGEWMPACVSASAHNESGAQLARQWDQFERSDTHPIIYVANGSHANYFTVGARPVAEFVVGARTARWLARLRAWLLRQMVALVTGKRVVTFVDFAQGDGDSVGPGALFEWSEPVLLDEIGGTDEWGAIRTFRGLWGRYVGDWTGRENGPCGPPFTYGRLFPTPEITDNKLAWRDPLAWAGLQVTNDPARSLKSRLPPRYAHLTQER